MNASGSLPTLALQVEQLHQEADAAVADYARQTGLACPSGCGACCHSPEIEVTVLDALPLAFSIVSDSEAAAELMLEAIRAQQAPGCPVFVDQGAEGDLVRGHCSRYDRRPSFCRLYGFAAVPAKTGLPVLALCRTQKQRGVAIDVEVRPPLFTEFSRRLQAMHPDLGTRHLPIHRAISEALEKVLLAAQLHRDSSSTPTDWGVPPIGGGVPQRSPNYGGGENVEGAPRRPV